MALLSSPRIVNANPGNVTVVVKETTQSGSNDAIVTVRMEINTTEAAFGAGHTQGFVPANPVDLISWENFQVLTNTTETRKAVINKLQTSDAAFTTVHCTVNGTYKGAPYSSEFDAVVVWP